MHQQGNLLYRAGEQLNSIMGLGYLWNGALNLLDLMIYGFARCSALKGPLQLPRVLPVQTPNAK